MVNACVEAPVPRSSYREAAWRILLAALALRLAWGLAIPILPVSDSHAYDVFASNIAQGHGYGWEANRPSAYWPVGTSAIYEALFRLFGHNYTAVMLFQVLAGVVVVALAMSLARRWFSATAAVTTGWILACWPLLIQYTTLLASELYFVLFVLAAFWFASMPGRAWAARAVSCGVALAAASYVRPLALIMAPLMFAREAMLVHRKMAAVSACMIAILAMLLCILPWTLRNWQVLDRFVLISTNGGANLWMGNNPHSSGGYMPLPPMDMANEADRDRFLGRQARDYIIREPIAFLERAVRKAIALHDRESIGVVWNEKGIVQRAGHGMLSPMKLFSSAYWWLILGTAAYGVLVLVRHGGLLQLLVCPPVAAWLYFTLVHSVTVAGDRYHVPSIPFVAMIAAYAWGRFRAAPEGDAVAPRSAAGDQHDAGHDGGNAGELGRGQ